MAYFRCSGESGPNVTIDGKSYDDDLNLVSNNAIIINTLPFPLYGGGSVVYNNELHIIGGYGGNYHYKWNGKSWTQVSTMPSVSFIEGTALVYNNEIHIIGALNYNDYHYKYNGSSWSKASTNSRCFGHSKSVVYNNEIHVLGGMYDNTETLHHKWNGSSWSQVSTLPISDSPKAAFVYNNEIVAVFYNSGDYYYYKWNGSSWTKLTEDGVLRTPFLLYNNNLYGFYDDSCHTWNGSGWRFLKDSGIAGYLKYDECHMINNELHFVNGYGSNWNSKHYILNTKLYRKE